MSWHALKTTNISKNSALTSVKKKQSRLLVKTLELSQNSVKFRQNLFDNFDTKILKMHWKVF